jgi:rubrerythrin
MCIRDRDLSDEERQWIEEQAGAVDDPELRAVFESLIRKDREHKD